MGILLDKYALLWIVLFAPAYLILIAATVGFYMIAARLGEIHEDLKSINEQLKDIAKALPFLKN